MKMRYCSFCGKERAEVFYLVEGPTVYICDECVVLCADVVQERRAAAARGEQVDQPHKTMSEFIARHRR